MSKPTIGRVVIYRAPEILPAVITAVHDDTHVDLRIHQEGHWGLEARRKVAYGQGAGQWDWTEPAEVTAATVAAIGEKQDAIIEEETAESQLQEIFRGTEDAPNPESGQPAGYALEIFPEGVPHV